MNFNPDLLNFPIKLSANVINYLYPFFKGGYSSHLSLEEFKEILKGQNKSPHGLHVLGSVCSIYHNSLYYGTEIKFDEFDIITDITVASTKIKEFSYHKIFEDVHKGECILKNNIFEFEYKITRTIDEYHQFVTLNNTGCVVNLKGHTFLNQCSYLHSACGSYIVRENLNEEEKIRKEEFKKEEQTWIEFRNSHKQELKDWLIPILENQYKGHACERMRVAIYNGFPSYRYVKDLDRGQCHSCSGECQFKETILGNGEHSKEWYELGLDKLDFKLL